MDYTKAEIVGRDKRESATWEKPAFRRQRMRER